MCVWPFKQSWSLYSMVKQDGNCSPKHLKNHISSFSGLTVLSPYWVTFPDKIFLWTSRGSSFKRERCCFSSCYNNCRVYGSCKIFWEIMTVLIITFTISIVSIYLRQVVKHGKSNQKEDVERQIRLVWSAVCKHCKNLKTQKFKYQVNW